MRRPAHASLKVAEIMVSRRGAVLAAIAGGFLSISSGSIKAAEADRVDARFEIFGFAGLHVLTNRTTVDETADRYAISMDLDTLASPASSWILRAILTHTASPHRRVLPPALPRRCAPKRR